MTDKSAQVIPRVAVVGYDIEDPPTQTSSGRRSRFRVIQALSNCRSLRVHAMSNRDRTIRGAADMPDHIYKIVELVGSSEESVTKAIDRAISKAALTLRHLGWFEVLQVRGHIEDGKVAQYQVTIKAGFRLEDE
jgi:dodecin